MLAPDASSLRAARVTRGLLGRRRGVRVQATAQAALPARALVPAAAAANIRDPAALRAALQRVGALLDIQPGANVRLVLPDALGRLVLLETPRGVVAEDFVRFRLAGSLPFGIDEAHVGAVSLPTGGLLASALAQPVVAEYEAAVEQAGWRPDGVVLGPLASLDGWLAHVSTSERAALVQGDAGCVLALMAGGQLRLVRSRLRVDGLALSSTAEWLAAELRRSAVAANLETLPPVDVLGPGAAVLSLALQRTGVLADVAVAPEGVPAEATEWAWLWSAAA